MQATKSGWRPLALLAALACALALALAPAVVRSAYSEEATGSTLDAGGTYTIAVGTKGEPASYYITPTESGLYDFTLSVTVELATDESFEVRAKVYEYVEFDYVGSIYLGDDVDGYSFDGVDTYTSSSNWMFLAAGETYLIEVYSVSGDGYIEPTSATIGFDLIEADQLTVEQAYTISIQGDESTCLTFTPTSSGDYTFALAGEAVQRLYICIEVYDAEGEELGYVIIHESDDDADVSVSGSAKLTVSLTAGETYYIEYFCWSVSTNATVSVAQGSALSIARLAGENRYETAAAVADEAWWYTSSDYVIVAAGKNDKDTAYADALAASYAAGVLDCSVVLTKPGELTDATVEAIAASGAAHVIIVGGTSAVSEEVADAIAELSGVEEVTRIAGSNRYETAALVYDEFAESASGTAILAVGTNYADALCASPLSYAAGWPILLTKTDELPAATVEALADFDEVIIVGGTAAVSQAVEDELAAMGITVTRLAGSTRFYTALVIAEYAIGEGILSADVAGIAYGLDYPDALAGGSLVGARGGVLLLAAGDSLSASRNAALSAFLDEYGSEMDEVYLFGGTSVISESLEEELAGLLL